MKKVVTAFVVIALLPLMAAAEDFPEWEVFGGFSLTHSDVFINDNIGIYSRGFGLFGSDRLMARGFDTAITRNLNPWMGVKASFSGHFGSLEMDSSLAYSSDREYSSYIRHTDDLMRATGKMDYRRFNVLFGPEFSYRGNDRVRPFAHALFGFSKMTMDGIGFETELMSSNTFSELDEEWIPSSWDDHEIISGTSVFRGKAGFAMALGGGVDIKAGKHASIRLIQVDYMPTYNRIRAETDATSIFIEEGELFDFRDYSFRLDQGSNRFKNIKLSFGLVLNF
jgi:hypothetical protein